MATALPSGTPLQLCRPNLSANRRSATAQAIPTIRNTGPLSIPLPRNIATAYTQPTVRLERGHGFAACDDGHPPPKAGERWIVYFWKRGEGDQQAWQSYPAEVALKATQIFCRLPAKPGTFAYP